MRNLFEVAIGDMTRKIQEKCDKAINETMSCKDDAGEWIKDFQNSKDERFKGDSKKKRKEKALAARYAKCEDVVDGVYIDPDGLYKNNEYMFFVVAGNRLVSGFEYKEDALDDKRDNIGAYTKISPVVKLMSRKFLKNKIKTEINEDEVGVPMRNALKMLLAAGLKEDDLMGALNQFGGRMKEHVTMDQVKSLANKHGLVLGSDMFQ